MAQFIALWRDPDDVEGFERHYRDVHMPLAERWPGVQSLSTTRVTGDPMGDGPAYHLVFVARFGSMAELQSMLESTEMIEAGKDARDMMTRYGVSLETMIGEDL